MGIPLSSFVSSKKEIEAAKTPYQHSPTTMKLSIFSTLAFPTSFASLINMSNQLNNATKNPSLRTFGTVEQILLSDYQNYGCWCYLAQVPKGKGQPVNQVDELCRRLLQGYEC